MDISIEFHEVGHGMWTWEINDEFGTYLRAERVFADKAQARNDLEQASHLIHFHMSVH